MHGLILLAQIPFVLRIPELLAEPGLNICCFLFAVCWPAPGSKVFIAKTIVNGPRKTLPGGNGAATARITSFKPFQSESILFHLPIRWDDLRRLQ